MLKRFCISIMILLLLLTGVTVSAEESAEDPIATANAKAYPLMLVYDVIETGDTICVVACFGNRYVDEVTQELFVEGFDASNTVILQLADDCELLFPADARENQPLTGPSELIKWYQDSIAVWCTDRSFHAYYSLNEQLMLTSLAYYGDMYD